MPDRSEFERVNPDARPTPPFRARLFAGLVALLLALLPTLFMAGPALGQGMMDSSSRVAVTATPARQQVAPGGDVPIAVVFDHDENWHIHTNDPQVPPELGDASLYIATAIEASAPADGAAQPHVDHIQWPKPKTVEVAFVDEPVNYDVFAGKAVAYLPVTIPQDAPTGEVTLDLQLTYQACDDRKCLAPVRGKSHSVTFEIVPPEQLAGAQSAADKGAASLFADFDPSVWETIRSSGAAGGGAQLVSFGPFNWQFEINIATGIGLALLLLLAGIGGFLLNLTPCVLPMIPLKIMGLSQMAGSRGRCFALGSTMSLGVVTFWLGLGIAIALTGYLLRQGTIAEGSGITTANELFQYPAFTITVGALIAIMALGMCGLFSVGLPKWVYKFNPGHDTYHGSFGFGIMTAILSTPCTAPFMGAAAAGAVTQRPIVALAVFAAIGAGMALPYLVLAALPRLVDKMPRTGPASELIKQVMGLLMLAAAAFFVGTGVSGALNEPPGPPSRAYWWAVAAFIAAAGAWLAWRTVRITPRMGRRIAFGGLGVLFVAAGAYTAVGLSSQGPIDWVYYTPDRFEQAMDEDKTVVMEFTAEWCLNCKALEQSVLHKQSVVEALGRPSVVPMKVDLTGNNPVGNRMLRNVDRLTIPLLVVFAPDGSETLKTDFYTVNQVLGAIEKAEQQRVAAR